MIVAGEMGDRCKLHDTSHFKSLDKNSDGFVDKDEAKAGPVEHFDEMDTNHDGKLSKDEIKHCKCHHGKHPHEHTHGE